MTSVQPVPAHHEGAPGRLAFISRPEPITPEVPEHPSANGPFGPSNPRIGAIVGPQITQVAVVSPLLTRASIISGIANIGFTGGGVVSYPVLGSNAVGAVVHDTAAKRLPHNGVVDHAMQLNLVSLFAGSDLGAF